MIRIGVGGAWKAAQAFVGVGGAWKPTEVFLGVGGAWKPLGSGLAAAAAPAVRVATRSGPGTVTTGVTVVTVTGGVAPFAYAWARASGDAVITATADDAAATAFTADIGLGETLAASFACAVTDALGQTAVSNLVNAILHETS